jgi:hypothetical protein
MAARSDFALAHLDSRQGFQQVLHAAQTADIMNDSQPFVAAVKAANCGDQLCHSSNLSDSDYVPNLGRLVDHGLGWFWGGRCFLSPVELVITFGTDSCPGPLDPFTALRTLFLPQS